MPNTLYKLWLSLCLFGESVNFPKSFLIRKALCHHTPIKTYSITKSHNYFIENGNVSKFVEDLGIKTIPHYLIYNPNGELINGFANRPGKGTKEQLSKLLTEK